MVWRVCGVRFHTSQTKRSAIKFSVILGELLDFDKLICAHIRKILFRIARRPPNLQLGDLRGLAEPNMLLKGRAPKRTAAPDGSIDGAPRFTLILHGQMDARPDCRAIRPYTDKLEHDPVVAVTRVLKNAEGMRVTGRCASDGDEDVFPSIVAEVSEGHAVTFVELAGARRGSN